MSLETEDKVTNFIGRVWPYIPERNIETYVVHSTLMSLFHRDPNKYGSIALGLDALKIFDWREHSSPLPALYCAGRAVDDVADGQRKLPKQFSSFSEWVIHLKKIVETGGAEVPKGRSVDFLLKRALYRLEPFQEEGDDIKQEFYRFFDAMEVEHNRRINQTVLTKAELKTLNINSFSHVFNLTLIAIGSWVRATDIPEMPPLLGQSYAIRDLETDVSLGICNIPKEILESSGVSFPELREDITPTHTNQGIQAWIAEEVEECKRLITLLDTRKLDLPGKLFVKVFSGSVRDRILGKTWG